MSSTVIFTGVLPFVILIATVLAFPICFALLNAVPTIGTEGDVAR